MFTTREIATIVWLTLVIILALFKHNVRSSVLKVITALFRKQIIAPIILILTYNILVVYGLYAIGFWSFALLKDTVVWFVFAAIPLMVSFITSKDSENIFHKILVDNLKALIIVEYIVGTYTFPLLVELLLLPFAFFVVMLDVVARSDPKFASASKAISIIQLSLGLAVLSLSLYGAALDYLDLFSPGTLSGLFLTPLLSILLSPFIFLAVLYSRYESLFVMLNVGPNKSRDIKGYARRRIFKYLAFNLDKIQEFHYSHGRKLIMVQTKDDIDRILRDA